MRDSTPWFQYHMVWNKQTAVLTLDRFHYTNTNFSLRERCSSIERSSFTDVRHTLQFKCVGMCSAIHVCVLMGRWRFTVCVLWRVCVGCCGMSYVLMSHRLTVVHSFHTAPFKMSFFYFFNKYFVRYCPLAKWKTDWIRFLFFIFFE